LEGAAGYLAVNVTSTLSTVRQWGTTVLYESCDSQWRFESRVNERITATALTLQKECPQGTMVLGYSKISMQTAQVMFSASCGGNGASTAEVLPSPLAAVVVGSDAAAAAFDPLEIAFGDDPGAAAFAA